MGHGRQTWRAGTVSRRPCCSLPAVAPCASIPPPPPPCDLTGPLRASACYKKMHNEATREVRATRRALVKAAEKADTADAADAADTADGTPFTLVCITQQDAGLSNKNKYFCFIYFIIAAGWVFTGQLRVPGVTVVEVVVADLADMYDVCVKIQGLLGGEKKKKKEPKVVGEYAVIISGHGHFGTVYGKQTNKGANTSLTGITMCDNVYDYLKKGGLPLPLAFHLDACTSALYVFGKADGAKSPPVPVYGNFFQPKIRDYRSTGHVICCLSPPSLSLSLSSLSLSPSPSLLRPGLWSFFFLLPEPSKLVTSASLAQRLVYHRWFQNEKEKD